MTEAVPCQVLPEEFFAVHECPLFGVTVTVTLALPVPHPKGDDGVIEAVVVPIVEPSTVHVMVELFLLPAVSDGAISENDNVPVEGTGIVGIVGITGFSDERLQEATISAVTTMCHRRMSITIDK